MSYQYAAETGTSFHVKEIVAEAIDDLRSVGKFVVETFNRIPDNHYQQLGETAASGVMTVASNGGEELNEHGLTPAQEAYRQRRETEVAQKHRTPHSNNAHVEKSQRVARERGEKPSRTTGRGNRDK